MLHLCQLTNYKSETLLLLDMTYEDVRDYEQMMQKMTNEKVMGEKEEKTKAQK